MFGSRVRCVIARRPSGLCTPSSSALAFMSLPRLEKPSRASLLIFSPLGPRSSKAPCLRSEEHTSELQSLMRISYAVFCLKKKKNTKQEGTIRHQEEY